LAPHTGIEVWRIEKLEAQPVDPATYGQFYTGDCYIVLRTYEVKGQIFQDLHFWLGNECSQDERGACAYKTVELDDMLGGKPVQYRETQGHESEKFLAIFPKMQLLDGGVASGFRHVDPDKFEPRLYHVKGKRHVKVEQVKLAADSLNDGDVFILDLGRTLYQWNGRTANKNEKFKALEFITKVRNEERGGKADIIPLDSGREEEKFWAALGGKHAVRAGQDDDDDVKEEPPRLFRVSDSSVSDASGAMTVTEVASGHGNLNRDMLDGNDAFILDTSGNVFVWVGKGANKNERNKAMQYGEDYLKQSGRPAWTPVTRVAETGETPAFKSFFGLWDKPKVWTAGQPKPEVKELDEAGLYSRVKQAEEKMIDDATGSVKVWRIENMQRVEVPKELYGQFFMGDSYLVLYSYKKASKEKYIIYFWQGSDSSVDERGASALLAVQLDEELGGDPGSQVRVVQGKEPNHFLALFRGRFVVHPGGVASAFASKGGVQSNYSPDGNHLYHVKGTSPINTRAVSVTTAATSLNSGDCFILLASNASIWFGVGANAEERAVAQGVANVIRGEREVVHVEEGSETAEFWEALGGQADYPRSQELAGPPRDPRLFGFVFTKKGVSIQEIFEFSQDDLLQEDVMILDSGAEVFVWIGHDATKDKRDRAFQSSLNYVKNVNDGRSADTPVYQVNAGSEPPNFTCHFLGWNDDKASDFADPYARAAAKLAPPNKAEAKLVEVKVSDIGHAAAAGKTYPVDVLKGFKAENNPDSIDLKRKQDYLDDASFTAVLKMSKAEFAKLPGWKQDNAKKAAGLF